MLSGNCTARSGTPGLQSAVLLRPRQQAWPCRKIRHRQPAPALGALGVDISGGATDGGSSSGGDGGAGSSNNRFGPQWWDEPQQKQQHRWLKLAAAAAVGYTVLGLVQPQRLLCPQQQIDTSRQSVAIIIPVLNEAAAIVSTLQALQQLQPPVDQVIVVDGGSSDNTVKLASSSGLASKVLQSGRGRAVQMNAGAQATTADLLCFLHADTRPPADLVSVMRRELRDPQTVLAGFVPSIEVPGRRLWLMSFHNFISTYYAPLLFRPLSFVRGLRALFGDQTMFCRARDFKAVGGFDTKLSIMEDADLCVRMHMAGPAPQQRQQRQRHQPSTTHNSSNSDGSSSTVAAAPLLSGPAEALAALLRSWECWRQPRGRVRQVLDRLSVTSGRRLAAWGNWKATYIHVVMGCAWYFGKDPQQLKELYVRLYTDSFR